MHPISVPEVVGAILTFIGGILLTIDAFAPVRTLYVKRGGEKGAWLVSRLPAKATASSPSPAAVTDDAALAHARQSQKLVRAGLILITVGFLLDILTKVHVL